MTELDRILASLSDWERDTLIAMGMSLRKNYRPRPPRRRDERMEGWKKRLAEERKRTVKAA